MEDDTDLEELLDCNECHGSCECTECDEDGINQNTCERCHLCSGTHVCPKCGGSGTQSP